LVLPSLSFFLASPLFSGRLFQTFFVSFFPHFLLSELIKKGYLVLVETTFIPIAAPLFPPLFSTWHASVVLSLPPFVNRLLVLSRKIFFTFKA